MNAGALNEVAGSGKHGYATVLQLSGAEPGQGRLRAETSEIKRIKGREGGCRSCHVFDAGGDGHGTGTLAEMMEGTTSRGSDRVSEKAMQYGNEPESFAPA